MADLNAIAIARKQGTEDFRKPLCDANDILLVNATGTFTASGLSKEIKITTMEVSDVAGKIPLTPLTDRNSMCIHNKDAVETLYIGPSNVTAGDVLGTTSGYEVLPKNEINIDIADDIELYAIAPAGKTILIKVMELA